MVTLRKSVSHVLQHNSRPQLPVPPRDYRGCPLTSGERMPRPVVEKTPQQQIVVRCSALEMRQGLLKGGQTAMDIRNNGKTGHRDSNNYPKRFNFIRAA